MNIKTSIRETIQSDITSLKILYKKAFTDEDLFPLVTELLNDKQNTFMLSALHDGDLVGHIAFTKCHAKPSEIALSLLGPMAVLPLYQGKGIGTDLIKEGFNHLKKSGVEKAIVFGDPNFYGRSGFTIESNIEPAYSIAEEYIPGWQSISFSNTASAVSGKLQVTRPWQRQDLW
ncbi:MAG: hypothetical protein DHS20C08_22160 [Rhodomicrobium sp.]|nr:MAG: hypothetical protein DHS20C08_22160 [Rhodomicrobium sp.]